MAQAFLLIPTKAMRLACDVCCHVVEANLAESGHPGASTALPVTLKGGAERELVCDLCGFPFGTDATTLLPQ